MKELYLGQGGTERGATQHVVEFVDGKSHVHVLGRERHVAQVSLMSTPHNTKTSDVTFIFTICIFFVTRRRPKLKMLLLHSTLMFPGLHHWESK